MHYLKSYWSNLFEILRGYWCISEDVHFWISDGSDIQYGRQAAILDFRFRSITQEPLKQLAWNLVCGFIMKRYRSSLIFRPIGNPIWQPGSHLGFPFPLNISRTIRAIDLKFGMWFYHEKIQVKVEFGTDPKSNMAARPSSWISISAQ